MEEKQTETKITNAEVVQTKDGQLKVIKKDGKHRGVGVLLDTDDVVRDQVGGFANFLREYAVVGLAVGFIVGQQANTVVKSLVDTFVNPLVAVWFGQDLKSRVAILHHGQEPVQLPWGGFVYAMIEFFLVLITLYVIIKLFKLDKLRKVEQKAKRK
jgi:large conductance mechanosensitive channel